jgi:hypothetical protein
MDSFAGIVLTVLFIFGPYLFVLNINIMIKKLREEPLTKWEVTYERVKENIRGSR